MGNPKRDPINRLPFTPLATDVFIRETHNVVRPGNFEIPEFGTPHDAISKGESWPHHRFCWQTEINEKGDCERWFVATPEAQHLYNWQYNDAPDWPVIRQAFVIPREDFDPTFLGYTPPSTDVFADMATYTITNVEQTRIGEKQLDSLFVSVTVTWEKIAGNPKIAYILDPQTNEIRQVLEEKVPAGTLGTAVDANGQYSEVKPINTLWALKTTQFVAGIAGKTAPKQQVWNDVLNYSWPDVLYGFDQFAFPSSSGSIDSVTLRPIWKRQRYDGPCEATITESWSLTPPAIPTLTPMLPREIEYRTPLVSASTPPCLHGDIYLYDTPGTSHPSLGFYFYEQFYPATNLTDWPSTYLASFTVRPAAGGYLARKVEVKRPIDGALLPNTLTIDPPTPGTVVNTADVQWTMENLDPLATVDYRLDVNSNSQFTGTYLTGFNGKDLNTSTSDTITGMTAQTPYYIRVRAFVTLGMTTTEVFSNTVMYVPQPVAAFTLTESATPIVSGGTLAYGSFTEKTTQIVKTLTITNTGNLTLSGVAVTATGLWSLGALSGSSTMAPGATRTFTLTFAPNSAGTKTGTCTVLATNAASLAFNLTGTAVAANPEVTVRVNATEASDGDTLSFTNTVAASASIELLNTYWTAITGIAAVANTDPPNTSFSISGAVPSSLNPGEFATPFSLDYDGDTGATGDLRIGYDTGGFVLNLDTV